MAFVFNIAKGRVAEFYNRVDTNDPANSALVVVVLRAANIEADSVLQDYDTLSALLAGASDEATNSGYARKVLTDANITALTPDDSNNWTTLTIADQLYGNVVAGDVWAKMLICYDNDTTAGTDANIIPLTGHNLSLSPNGLDILVTIPSSGFFKAI